MNTWAKYTNQLATRRWATQGVASVIQCEHMPCADPTCGRGRPLRGVNPGQELQRGCLYSGALSAGQPRP